MAELIAQGRNPTDQWRRELPIQAPVVLGREQVEWAVPWDPFISRRHAEVVWKGGRLRVSRLPRARNPILVQGKENNSFEIVPGDFFVIGETTFLLSEDPTTKSVSALPAVQEMTISPLELANLKVRDAQHQLDVLSRLPDVISGAANDHELFQRLVEMLLAGVRRADAVALVAVENADADHPNVRVLHAGVRRGSPDEFRPSQHLTLEAVLRRRQTVVHVWNAESGDSTQYTLGGAYDWAFCSPLQSEACKNWGIYITGKFGGTQAETFLAPWETNELADDLKFIELVAAILRALRQVKQLQRKQDSLSRFFSPAVLRALTANSDPERALQPCEADVSVLFCDLRGFSRKAETHAGDLIALLERVSKALGFMTQTILDHGGVIGDYQGDAAMGFWGWPLADPHMVKQTCLAALGIRTLFEASALNPEHPLHDFRVGIGIATGNAVAGQIGTTEQVKVTVFGPVVNLASRLEGMTKLLRVPILLDEATAKAVREQLPATSARCRRLAVVQPYGIDAPLTVSELLPPLSEYPLLSDLHLAQYEAALDAFLKGDWTKTYELLHLIPPQDRAKDFLLGFIIQNNHAPPANWNGVIPLSSKG